MAVVFISPKKRQKSFFFAITIALVLFLAVMSLWIFLARPNIPAASVAFNKPKITIDLKILDSNQFKDLEHFELMPLQFRYSAENAKKITVSGTISAVSKEDALKVLEQRGLTVNELEEINVGRDNPFVPY
jgi:hypothetical protein